MHPQTNSISSIKSSGDSMETAPFWHFQHIPSSFLTVFFLLPRWLFTGKSCLRVMLGVQERAACYKCHGCRSVLNLRCIICTLVFTSVFLSYFYARVMSCTQPLTHSLFSEARTMQPDEKQLRLWLWKWTSSFSLLFVKRLVL